MGSTVTLQIATPAEIVLQFAVARRTNRVVDDRLEVTNNGRAMPTREIVDVDGGRQHVVQAQPGVLSVAYEGVVGRHGPAQPERVTDAARIVALRPSRYCPSDRLSGFARGHFGNLPSARERVDEVCRYVWEHVGYDTSVSTPTGDAVDTLSGARGGCRDFAHLVVALCRAVDVPARMVAVYAPGLSPMDFHAVVETAIDGVWRIWDSTRLAPRETMIRIATGRDAADVAFVTTLSGEVELSDVDVSAVAPGDLPLDDHERPVLLD